MASAQSARTSRRVVADTKPLEGRGARGAAAISRHLRASLQREFAGRIGRGGTWYLPDFEERRLRALADSFASWARRSV